MTYSLLDAHEFQSEDLHNCPTHGKFCFANLGQHIRIAHALSSEHVSCILDDSGLVSRTEHARTRHRRTSTESQSYDPGTAITEAACVNLSKTNGTLNHTSESSPNKCSRHSSGGCALVLKIHKTIFTRICETTKANSSDSCHILYTGPY